MEYQNYEEYMRRVLGYSSADPNIYETYPYRNSSPYHNTYDRNEYAVSLSEEQADALYPEIYRLINPMVCKMCNSNTEPITQELLEKMTDEICSSLGENETVVNVRIETPREASRERTEKTKSAQTRTERPISKLEEIRANRSSREMRTSIDSRTGSERREQKARATSVENSEIKSNREIAENNRSSKEKENRQSSSNTQNRETRRPNQNLRDLIKILILKQLLGGNNNRPPVRPPRPPYPGGPGMMPPPRPPYPGGRPPMGGGPNNPPIRPRDYEDYLKF